MKFPLLFLVIAVYKHTFPGNPLKAKMLAPPRNRAQGFPVLGPAESLQPRTPARSREGQLERATGAPSLAEAPQQSSEWKAALQVSGPRGARGASPALLPLSASPVFRGLRDLCVLSFAVCFPPSLPLSLLACFQILFKFLLFKCVKSTLIVLVIQKYILMGENSKTKLDTRLPWPLSTTAVTLRRRRCFQRVDSLPDLLLCSHILTDIPSFACAHVLT